MNNPFIDVFCPHCGEFVNPIYEGDCPNCGEYIGSDDNEEWDDECDEDEEWDDEDPQQQRRESGETPGDGAVAECQGCCVSGSAGEDPDHIEGR